MSKTLTDKQYSDLKNVVKIQGSKGNWDTGEYMNGMYNGMELALSIVEDREPKYKSLPETFPNKDGSGGDKAALSDDQDMPRKYREHMRKIQGLPSQEPDPTPDPIAFDHTSVLKILFDHHNGYVPPRETDEITIQELLKLHNQSLQTAVTQARIDELKRVVEQLPGEHTNHGIRIGVAEAYHVLEIVIEARIAELTKAKEDSKS